MKNSKYIEKYSNKKFPYTKLKGLYGTYFRDAQFTNILIYYEILTPLENFSYLSIIYGPKNFGMNLAYKKLA
jgi:hypothetical protein